MINDKLLQYQSSFSNYTVRLVKPSDASGMCSYYRRNKKHLAPWEPARPNSYYLQDSIYNRLLKLHELHRFQMSFQFVIEDNHSHLIIGLINFTNINRFPSYQCNVGYSLDYVEQGKGVMHRALKATCHLMFDKVNMHRINASYMIRNTKSEKVLQSIGFEEEGIVKDYLLINGCWEDHKLVGLINEHWTIEHNE